MGARISMANWQPGAFGDGSMYPPGVGVEVREVIVISETVKCCSETEHKHFTETCERSSSVILNKALVVI